MTSNLVFRMYQKWTLVLLSLSFAGLGVINFIFYFPDFLGQRTPSAKVVYFIDVEVRVSQFVQGAGYQTSAWMSLKGSSPGENFMMYPSDFNKKRWRTDSHLSDDSLKITYLGFEVLSIPMTDIKRISALGRDGRGVWLNAPPEAMERVE
jgi:hypothetical protein